MEVKAVSDLSNSYQVAIVAALEREVAPLIHGWTSTQKASEGHSYTFFESGTTVLVCAGIGAEAARRAAEAIIKLHNPALVISTGFAGASDRMLAVGQIVVPTVVVDARDGSRTSCDGEAGTLVSFSEIATAEQKTNLREAYGAQAVDMEAAAVAHSAEVHGVKFLACKAISDTSDSTLLPVARFVNSEGKFDTVRFVGFLALRPWLWSAVARLAADSKKAAESLSQALTELCAAQASSPELQVVHR